MLSTIHQQVNGGPCVFVWLCGVGPGPRLWPQAPPAAPGCWFYLGRDTSCLDMILSKVQTNEGGEHKDNINNITTNSSLL